MSITRFVPLANRIGFPTRTGARPLARSGERPSRADRGGAGAGRRGAVADQHAAGGQPGPVLPLCRGAQRAVPGGELRDRPAQRAAQPSRKLRVALAIVTICEAVSFFPQPLSRDQRGPRGRAPRLHLHRPSDKPSSIVVQPRQFAELSSLSSRKRPTQALSHRRSPRRQLP
jgi:hypothetical protein